MAALKRGHRLTTTYYYVCDRNHNNERTFNIPAALEGAPAFIKCRFHYGDRGSTHYVDCRKEHECGRRAYKV